MFRDFPTTSISLLFSEDVCKKMEPFSAKQNYLQSGGQSASYPTPDIDRLTDSTCCHYPS